VLHGILSLRGRRSPAAWLRDDLRAARNDPLGPRASVRVRAIVQVVRERPRVILGLAVDVVVPGELYVAALAMIGRRPSCGEWLILPLAGAAYSFVGRVRAQHGALDTPMRGAKTRSR
jgi:hypothetical protein